MPSVWSRRRGAASSTAGSSGKRARPQIDDQTMFELGSITKTFTGALLENADGKEKRDTLVWHNGGTYGSNSFVGFDIERGIGVVVLINTGALGVADDIAMHLWDQRNPRPSITNEKND